MSQLDHHSPTLYSAVVFRGKSTLLQMRRAMHDRREGIGRFQKGEVQEFPFILAESRTPLWSETSDVEWGLQNGKAQNLRCAVRRLHGASIPAGATFRFWKQIGQATRRRGYVEGRLLREGCLIPAVGGGLCQLSNALYDVALQAGLEIVERWGHSRVVPGSAAALGRDATVAWNYIDLRFRPTQALLIEAFLMPNELVVRLRGCQQPSENSLAGFIPLATIGKARPMLDAGAHSCVSCGVDNCFRHARQPHPVLGRTAYLMDECWPEFQEFIALSHEPQDVLAIPLDGKRWKQARYAWPTGGFAAVHVATLHSLMRSMRTRRLGRYGARRLQAQLEGASALAAHLARALSPDVTRLVVAQSLLPFLYHEGHLGGREVQVLMTRLPLHVLHDRLDAAAALHPERHTLCEFRAPQWLVEAEKAALQNATVITPHGEIAALFGERAQHLNWCLPPLPRLTEDSTNLRRCIAFPGPTAARKGAYEVRAAARQLGLEVVLLGSELEGADFWQGVATRHYEGNWLAQVSAVVQPAVVEERPRHLLAAIATGLPVISSPACGLKESDSVTLVPACDETALIVVLRAIFHKLE